MEVTELCLTSRDAHGMGAVLHQLEQRDGPCSWPKTGRPHTTFSGVRTDGSVNAQIGSAPFGNSPSSATSTVTVPFCTAGSLRTTRPE